jgi:hypothetical protein
MVHLVCLDGSVEDYAAAPAALFSEIAKVAGLAVAASVLKGMWPQYPQLTAT